MLDGRKVGSVFVNDRSYDIKMVSTTDPVRDPGDLERLFLKTASGAMVPMSSVVTLEERAIAPNLTRESQMRAITITAGLSDALPLGAAYELAREMAGPLLKGNMRIVPLAEAATLGNPRRRCCGPLALRLRSCFWCWRRNSRVSPARSL